MKNIRIVHLLLFAFYFQQANSQNLNFQPAGIGGGGALYSPAINPHNNQELWVSCDMSAVYKSDDFGLNWKMQHAMQLQGNHNTSIQFTSDPQICYTIDHTPQSGLDISRPVISTDAGQTWSDLASDPTNGDAYTLICDPSSTGRLILSSYSNLYFSGNGGQSFQQIYTYNNNGNGLHVAGAFFDGTTIYIGTAAGMIVSINNGNTFYQLNLNGWSASSGIASFCGSKQGAAVKLYASSILQSDLYAGITGADYSSITGIYTCDGIASNWQLSINGINSNHHPFFVACSTNDINTVYCGGGNSQQGIPVIYKSIDGGMNWASVLNTTINANVITGWCGDGGDRGWGYPEYLLGLCVSPNDVNKVAFTDLGFTHVTNNGGISWRQAYIAAADENVASANTPTFKSYHSIGLENTSCWSLGWTDANHIIAAFSDINGIKSDDGGASWKMAGATTLNSTYKVLNNTSTNIVYVSTSSVHDIYQTTRLTDAILDPGAGGIRYSTNSGNTWQTLHDFNHPVVDIAIDPANSNRMYASVIHYANGIGEGGIWKSDNIQAGNSSVWSKLNSPPRTEGHPLSIKVLNDGTVVVSYCGRRNNSGVFTASSGVFVLPSGSSTWNDRSDAGMLYYTKDLVIDPSDPLQNTWYACVWSGWGGPPNGLGGLYKTTSRGLTWTRIYAGSDRISSMTFKSVSGSEAWISTETDGLWFATNLNTASPVFSRETGFPFRQPERMFFNPYNSNELWVTTFGGGLFHASLYSSTGINENSSTQIQLYPNPSMGKIFISAESEINSYQITDMRGRLIETKTGLHFNEIQIEEKDEGIYLIKLILKNGIQIHRKFIITGHKNQ